MPGRQVVGEAEFRVLVSLGHRISLESGKHVHWRKIALRGRFGSRIRKRHISMSLFYWQIFIKSLEILSFPYIYVQEQTC